MTNPSDPQEIQGEPLSPLDRFWLDAARSAAKESIAAHEEAAKQIIGVAGFAQTVYFAAISFSDLKKAMGQMGGEQQWSLSLLAILPIVCWIISLVFAILVFKPAAYRTNLNSPDAAKEMHQNIVAYKHKCLQRSHAWLVAGFLPLAMTLLLYLAMVPAPVGE